MRKIAATGSVSDGLRDNKCELVPAIYHGETNRNAAQRKSTFSRWGRAGSGASLGVAPCLLQAGWGLIVRCPQSQP